MNPFSRSLFLPGLFHARPLSAEVAESPAADLRPPPVATEDTLPVAPPETQYSLSREAAKTARLLDREAFSSLAVRIGEFGAKPPGFQLRQGVKVYPSSEPTNLAVTPAPDSR